MGGVDEVPTVGYRRANLYLFVCVGFGVYMGMRSGRKVGIKLFMMPRKTFHPDNGS